MYFDHVIPKCLLIHIGPGLLRETKVTNQYRLAQDSTRLLSIVLHNVNSKSVQ